MFLNQIRQDPEIKGLKHQSYEYKLRALADDILFILEDPLNTFGPLLGKIKEFEQLVGFYLNVNKSKIICKNVTKVRQNLIQTLMNCEVVHKTKYLGNKVTAKNRFIQQ